MQDPTLQDVLQAVQTIHSTVKETQQSVQTLETSVKNLETKVQENTTGIATLQTAVKNLHTSVEENREIIEFLKDNMASKDDLLEVETRLDKKIDHVQHQLQTEIQSVKNDMAEHVDSFVGMYKKQETELAAVSFRQQRTEEKTDTIAKHLNITLA